MDNEKVKKRLATVDALNKALESGVLSKKEYDKKFKDISKPDIPTAIKERFSIRKFLKGMFSLFDAVEWTKTAKEVGIFDVRKWIIYGLILGGIYGYAYMKGAGGKPVNFDMRGKEAHIALNEHYLHITPDGGARVEDEDGNILKTIKVSDIPELRRALKPIGFDVKPFFTAGGGVGQSYDGTVDGALEVGVGSSLWKFYKLHLDAWVTNKGGYLGADYKVFENSGLIGGIGKGYSGENRAYAGWKWNF